MNTHEIIALNFDYANKHYEGEAIPASSENASTTCPAFDIFIDDEYTGTIVKTGNNWRSDNHFDTGLIACIGSVLITLLMSL